MDPTYAFAEKAASIILARPSPSGTSLGSSGGIGTAQRLDICITLSLWLYSFRKAGPSMGNYCRILGSALGPVESWSDPGHKDWAALLLRGSTAAFPLILKLSKSSHFFVWHTLWWSKYYRSSCSYFDASQAINLCSPPTSCAHGSAMTNRLGNKTVKCINGP